MSVRGRQAVVSQIGPLLVVYRRTQASDAHKVVDLDIDC